MKRKPIENPKLIGCYTCSPIPFVILQKDRELWNEFCEMTNLIIDGENKEISFRSIDDHSAITTYEIEEFYKLELEECEYAEILIMSPIHDETYEYNKEDKQWHLVNQGYGFV